MAIVIEHGNAGANLASAAVEILNAYFGEENVGGVVVGDDTLLQ
jgi:penicillin-binding protein 2